MTRLRRTRVLMCTDQLAVGGAERVAVDIANTLDRGTHEVHFCATRAGGPLVERLRDDVEVRVLGRTATWDLRRLVQFGAWVRGAGIDVIHSHGRGTMRFVALARALRLVECRHVFHDHYNWLHVDRRARPSLRVPLRSVDAYMGVDGRLCEWARSSVGIDPGRVHLVRSGVDLSRFDAVEPVDLRALVGAPADALVLVMVGNLRPQKDHPTLVRALAALAPEERDRLCVAVVGSTTSDPTYHHDLLAMVERLGVGGSFHLLGARDDAPALIAAADAGVATSKDETGPLVVLEYMASGLPFLATDTGEISRAVRDLGVGWVTPPRDAGALADALRELLATPPEQRLAMGRRGHEEAVARFSQADVTRRVEAIYQGVLGLRGATRSGPRGIGRVFPAVGAPEPAVGRTPRWRGE